MPILTITDNADNTGGVATISGSASGTTNYVYCAAAGGAVDGGPGAWQLVASRSEDGDIAVNPGAGIYWWYVASDLSGSESVSELVYERLSTGQDTIHYQLLFAVQARIQSLALDGIDNANIVVHQLPYNRELLAYPAIVLSHPTVEQMIPTAGSQARDDIGYPIIVSIYETDKQTLDVQEHRLAWRHDIAKAFRNQRIPGIVVAGVSHFICRVEPGPIISPSAWLANYFNSAMTIRAFAREPRGL